jgi:hypothetical protein
MAKVALCRSCTASWLRARSSARCSNISPMDMEGRNDLARLSDAELLAQLSDTAKQLGVEINLNYSFLQQQKPDDERQG